MSTPQEYTGTRLSEWEKGKWYRTSEFLPLPKVNVTPVSTQFMCAVAQNLELGVEWLVLKWGCRTNLISKLTSGSKDQLTDQDVEDLSTPAGWTRPYWVWESPNFRMCADERMEFEDVIAWMDVPDVPPEWIPADETETEEEG